MTAADLRKRLQRLRVQKLRREVPPPAAMPRRRRAAGEALPGERVETRLGAFQLIENAYPAATRHGSLRLADVLGRDAAIAARLARDPALAEADLLNLAYLDTETTGLAGGAGTLVFLVGVGAWEGDNFVLRQYFLSDPAHEEALLDRLVDDLASRSGWVTYNGRAFDLPLLEGRLTLNRRRGALGRRPHLDLLTPARRLYRGRAPSCSLGDLEQYVFHLIRDQDDVPGALIPQMYQDFLRTGDPAEMRRVIYHNAVDILSMVTLAAHLLDVFATPAVAVGGGAEGPARTTRSPEEWLRLARWHEAAGREAEAEAAYRRALAGRLALDDRRAGLRGLALLLRRQDRRAEAAPLWEQLASFSLEDPEPFVELAKHSEWHDRQAAAALAWTERALAAVAAWPAGWRRDEAAAALQHRRGRLTAKLALARTEKL